MRGTDGGQFPELWQVECDGVDHYWDDKVARAELVPESCYNTYHRRPLYSIHHVLLVLSEWMDYRSVPLYGQCQAAVDGANLGEVLS